MSAPEFPASPVTPSPSPHGASVAPVAPPANLPDFFAALGNPLRWEMVKMLSSGRAMSATEVAAALHRDFDGVSKHLRVLREAGVLRSRAGEDKRLALFFIPEASRRLDGVLDYGSCVIRVG